MFPKQVMRFRKKPTNTGNIPKFSRKQNDTGIMDEFICRLLARRRAYRVRSVAVGILWIAIGAIASAPLLLASGARAAGPQPPCAIAAAPAYPLPDSAPTIVIWPGKELEQDNWHPPSCTGWLVDSPSKLVVTLTGSFRFDGPMSALLARVGTISALRSIQYWSTTDKRWGPLSNDASALTGPDPKSRRHDFSASELVQGADLYYWEDDTRTGSTVYRLRVSESTPERVVISSDNVTPVRKFIFTLFRPGALQSVLIIQRVAPGLFGVFVLSRSGEGASVLTAGHESSYVNRATALYRQLAGIKTDQEPPAAR